MLFWRLRKRASPDSFSHARDTFRNGVGADIRLRGARSTHAAHAPAAAGGPARALAEQEPGNAGVSSRHYQDFLQAGYCLPVVKQAFAGTVVDGGEHLGRDKEPYQ